MDRTSLPLMKSKDRTRALIVREYMANMPFERNFVAQAVALDAEYSVHLNLAYPHLSFTIADGIAYLRIQWMLNGLSYSLSAKEK
jgi:hypothetical protein